LAVLVVFRPGWTPAAATALFLGVVLYAGVRLGALEVGRLFRRLCRPGAQAGTSVASVHRSLAEIETLWERLKPVFEQMNLDRAVLTLEGLTDDGRANREIYQWARQNGQLVAELIHNRWSRQFLLDAERGRVATLHLECDAPWLSDEERIVHLIQQISENVRVVQHGRVDHKLARQATVGAAVASSAPEPEMVKAGA
jgi:hypothetical protein